MFLYVQIIFCAVMCLCIIDSSQDLKYKVIAPQYICSKDNMSLTTIRLIGEDVPYLKYNWSVNFHIDDINKESRNLKHRHIIIVWRSVRKLNEILQTMSKEDLIRGVIFINNSLLTPNVKYIINLFVQKPQNGTIKTDHQQIEFEYISTLSSKSSISASLSGPEVTYSDMPYTVKAEVHSCNENPDYQLSWQLLDKSKKMIREELSRSSVLQLPPGTFTSGNEYSILCLVLDKTNNKNKTSEALQVNVLKRGMQLSTYTKHLKIGINQRIYLNAFFSDPDCIAGELTFKWQCTNSNKESCDNFESANSTEITISEGFETPGSYLLTLTARKGSAAIEDSSVVEVVEEMVPVIDVENAVTSCNPTDNVKILAHISKLVPECTLQWTSVKDVKGYVFVDLNSIPGKPGIPVEVIEDDENLETFSEENAENNENFLDRQHDLLIQSTSDGSWSGLQGNSKYLFRLTASCKCIENNTSESGQEKFIISTADVVVETNKLPLINPLKVVPKSGQAMRTLFSFQTGQPLNTSKPILYKFGIINNLNKTIYLIEKYDETTTDTILPFHDESILTILEVCDSKNACNFTLGPKVIVKLPNNFTTVESNALLSNFKKSVFEQDYFSAFTLASMLLQTANKMSSKETLNLFDSSIKNTTKQEINSFLSANDNSWLVPATNLLKHIKIMDSNIQLPQDILNDILVLRDKISEKQNTLRKKQIKSEKLVALSRKLLSIRINKKSKRIVNEINIDEIKDYLQISELAIKRLTDFERVDTEKQKLREKLQYYIPRICQYLYNNYKTNERIELSTLFFEVEKINLIRKYNEYIFVPYETHLAAKLQIGRDLAERYRRQNGMCLGKIFFVDDYFNIPQYVYDAKLYSALTDEYLDAKTHNFGILIEMPVKSSVSSNQMFQCVLWQNGDWDMTKCKTVDEYSGKIRCACRSLGYFSMVPVERTTTTSSYTLRTSLGVDLVTQRYNAESAVATTVPNVPVINKQSHVTVLQQITSTEQTDHQKNYYQVSQVTERNIKSATIWSISLLSIGICTLLLAFLVLLRKLQRSKAVQSFQTVEYAKYFNEHNLE